MTHVYALSALFFREDYGATLVALRDGAYNAGGNGCSRLEPQPRGAGNALAQHFDHVVRHVGLFFEKLVHCVLLVLHIVHNFLSKNFVCIRFVVGHKFSHK